MAIRIPQKRDELLLALHKTTTTIRRGAAQGGKVEAQRKTEPNVLQSPQSYGETSGVGVRFRCRSRGNLNLASTTASRWNKAEYQTK